MSDTRQLLSRIQAFRTRLEEMPRLLPADSTPAQLREPQELARSINRVAEAFPSSAVAEAPKLTARAHRLLVSAKQLIDQQKNLSDDHYLRDVSENDPLSRFHRGTVGLTDSALRLAQVFPPSAEAQLRTCDGFEHLLHIIRHRMSTLELTLKTRRSDDARVERLTALLTNLQVGKAVATSAFIDLAELILDDSRQGGRLRFLAASVETDGVAKTVAMHALNVCQVLARIIPHDYEWAMKPTLPLIAALLMDVGMLDVPAEILAKKGPLDDSERRLIERHPHRSAELVRQRMPETGAMSEMILAHHERLDGTGYPNGFRADTIPSMSRLLSVADAYAALREDRPHRSALDSRATLTELLLLAEQGVLDRDFTEYFLNLSFYPLGTVVELTDGRTAVVVATHNSRTNLRATMRPMVAVLANAEGDVLPRPEFVDLATSEVGSILRTIPASERLEKLGEWYPDLCSG
jgi:HD-GYP domain-containing protein (c-di-GMP phosphodiesterase class II)